ncbi:MAG: type 4 pilus major pilin, partial [Pseudomonadota bacterium]
GGFVPTDIKTPTLGEFLNTWGGAIIVETYSGTTTRFDVAFEGVPAEACARIISYTGNQKGTTDGLDSIIVTADGSDTVFTTFPTDVAAVVAACDDSNDEAIMRWVLY